jgi:acetylornithine deacetylase/succinyl-diaminopimelate desuccinylase-like protein
MTLAPTAPAAATPDWDSARAETVAHLQRLIRFDTTNPPGNELPLARYLDEVLRAAGIETRLFEPTPGRAALIARLRATVAPEGGALLLLAHMDVVGVEAEHWTVDPFGGVIKDGYLYGRGAIDDKGMLAANLETMLLLKRHVVDAGGALARDVVFVATSDEETGGEWGLGWILAHHADLVRAEFAINEGGRTRIVGRGTTYLAVQTAEKVSHVVRMTAHGPGGDASVPLADNAVPRLGRALAAVGAYREPVRLTPGTRRFFAELAPLWPVKREGAAMADVASRAPARLARGARVLAGIPVLDALLRNGISPTVVNGGMRHNVIPTEASAILNVRTLPGASLDGLLGRLRRVIADRRVELTVEERGLDAPQSDLRSPVFAAIAATATALRPGIAVVPYLGTGATDSARLRRAGIQCYGTLPFPMVVEDEQRMHGNDERVPLDSLHFGVRLIFGVARRVCAKDGGVPRTSRRGRP